MRCLACDTALRDFEATRKSLVTNEYVDLCDTCFASAFPDDLDPDAILWDEAAHEESDE